MPSPDFEDLIQNLPDFWSRRANAQTEVFEFSPFGIPARVTANRSQILAAARLSAGRFSQAAETAGQPIQIRVVVGDLPPAPVPPDLPEHLVYAGVGDWITLSAGRWGHGFASLPGREAVIFLSPSLAAETRLISRYFIDHYLLNFILTEWAMLHASCVFEPKQQRLIMMIAPHNTGKSTTALHLLRAGYHFLADGMALLRREQAGFVGGGYPIGEVKLREDVLALFPEYVGETVRVREQRKTVVNLRSAHPERVVERLIRPASIQLCFAQRSGTTQTEIIPLTPDRARSLIGANTVYWDIPRRLKHNYTILQALLPEAALFHLSLGSDPDGIIAAIDGLGST